MSLTTDLLGNLTLWHKKKDASFSWHTEACDNLHKDTKGDAQRGGAPPCALVFIYRRSQFQYATKHRRQRAWPLAMSNERKEFFLGWVSPGCWVVGHPE